MPSITNKKLLDRMNRLIGHAQSNRRMIEEEKYCMNIIQQNLAVVSAIHKLNELILDRHLRGCVVKAMRSNDQKEHEKVIGEILDIYNHMS